jgi:hypothetical protein
MLNCVVGHFVVEIIMHTVYIYEFRASFAYYFFNSVVGFSFKL